MTLLVDSLVSALTTVGVPVGIGRQPANVGSKPFVVIWPDGGVRAADTMKANDGNTETWVCHCYGLTPESAAVAFRKLATAVYGLHRTVVNGRLVQYPENLTALPLSRDDDVNPPLYDLATEWRLRTSLA